MTDLFLWGFLKKVCLDMLLLKVCNIERVHDKDFPFNMSGILCVIPGQLSLVWGIGFISVISYLALIMITICQAWHWEVYCLTSNHMIISLHLLIRP